MADATSGSSASATEVQFQAQQDGQGSATESEDAQAEQWLGANIDAADEAGDGEQDGLGDAGKQALDRMKAKWREERDARQKLEAQLSEASKSGSEPAGESEQVDLDAIRAEAQKAGREAAASDYSQRLVRSEVQRAATNKLADPADALAFLNLDDFEVTADGDVDSDEITAAIDDLVTRKPHLAAQGGSRFEGSGDGGARNGSAPKQITSREELAKLSSADRLQAYHDGRLKTLLQT